jgi:polyisoprenoid-binding protein YceI
MKFCALVAPQSGERMALIFILFIQGLFNLSAETLRTNPDHSEILFQVPYLRVSEVTGRFKKFSGELKLTPQGRPSQIELQIDADSIDTGNKLRDSHLKRHDFLDSQAHPVIKFESQALQPRNNKFEASGTLIFKGKSRPLKLVFSLSEEVTDTWNKKSRFVKFDFYLSRRELGIDWNKTLPGEEFLLGDKIHLWGSFQLQPSGGNTHSTKHMIPDTPYVREREKILRGEKENSDFESTKGAAQTHTFPLSAASNKVEAKESNESSDPRSRLQWQIAFGIMGLLGFFSTIFIGVFFKRWFHKKTRENHTETGFMGLLTDLFIILIVFIYAVSLWELGWG